jgi:hypothetical protein
LAKVIEYDVTGVETKGGGGTGERVRPGVKVCRIVDAEIRTEKKDGSPANDIRVVLDFGPEYDWEYTYVGLSDAADWKLAEFIRALGLKEKGKLNVDTLKNKLLRVKVNSGEWEGQYSPDMGKFYPAQPGDEIGSASAISNGRAAGPDAEDVGEATAEPAAEADGICREDPNDPEVGSYDDWPDEDLTAELEARNLTMPGGRGTLHNKAIKALRADDEAADESATAVAEGAAAEPEAGSYGEWTLEELQKEWADRQMGEEPEIRGRNRDERLKAAMIEALEQDDRDNPFEG